MLQQGKSENYSAIENVTQVGELNYEKYVVGSQLKEVHKQLLHSISFYLITAPSKLLHCYTYLSTL
jgi:cytochrome oxidase Cu insertion factor (SCO1/SenC/PrrC family)